MHIFHICNNYVESAVHRNLIEALYHDDPTVRQTVFVPLRHQKPKTRPPLNSHVEIIYSRCIISLLRYFPVLKLALIFFSIIRHRQNIKNADILIGHTFWTDGVICLLLKILFKKKYLTFIRATDVNIFIAKLKHYHWLMKIVAHQASRVMFVSKIYQNEVPRKYPNIFSNTKISLLTNGIDQFWVEAPLQLSDQRIRKDILFVGRFNKVKNLPITLRAVEIARASDPALKLRVFGGSIDDFCRETNQAVIPPWVHVGGKVSSQILLREYQNALVLLLPSFQETFGLVYMEALSQGCPCIYTTGQGVDGLLPNSKFFCGINPRDPQEIANAILALSNDKNTEKLKPLAEEVRKRFGWTERGVELLKWCREDAGLSY